MKIQFICDRRQCKSTCSECHHTHDITHAANFEQYGDTYREKDPAEYNSCKGCRWEKCMEFKDAPCNNCCRNYEEDYFEPR